MEVVQMKAKKDKYLIFKSCRGLERPWLVFTPAERLTAPEYAWDRGFKTRKQAQEWMLAQSRNQEQAQ
jgi:hypothetical protein